jgi:thiamine biosynthesis protein ThiS
MLVNGQQKKLEKEIPLSEFLKKEGYDSERVAVEKNGAIVPKKSYETVMLSDNDKLEIVCFVGGG